MSDLVQQNSILQNALQLFLDQFNRPDVSSALLSLRPELTAGIASAVLNAQNVMTIRLEKWAYRTNAVNGSAPSELSDTDKVEVELANGDQVIGRVGHLNWNDLSLEHPDVTILKYRKL